MAATGPAAKAEVVGIPTAVTTIARIIAIEKMLKMRFIAVSPFFEIEFRAVR
jgi:hypothetical protein